VILDTNAFYSDVHATRDGFRALFTASASGDLEVVVPQVVLDELARQYPERLEVAIRALQSAVRKSTPELRSLGLTIPEVSETPLVSTADYASRLRRRMLDYRVRISATPHALSPFLAWSVAKRRPFKKSGAGLPDAVIWASVLHEARDVPVILVTDNVSDFGDPADPTRVHEDLRQDLVSHALPANRVRIVRDMQTLLIEVVRPVSLPDARAERLLGDPGLGPSFRRTLEDALAYDSTLAGLLDYDVDLADDPEVTNVVLREVRLLSARELAPTRLLLDLEVEAVLDVEVTVPEESADDLYSSWWSFDVSGSSGDGLVEAQAEVDVTMRVEVTTSLDAAFLEVEPRTVLVH